MSRSRIETSYRPRPRSQDLISPRIVGPISNSPPTGRGASSRTGRAGTLRPDAAGDGRGAAGSGRSRWRDPSTTPPAAPAGRPGSDRLRGQPHRHIAASNEGPVIGRPVHNAVLRLVSGMDLRLHPSSVTPAEGPEKCGPRRPTRNGYSCNNAVRLALDLRLPRHAAGLARRRRAARTGCHPR